MSPATTQTDTPSLLQFPFELRAEIYRNLLCINRTRKQKPLSESILSTSRYSWNLHTSILATCRQIHDDARNILIRENNFVVFECATGVLEPTSANRFERCTTYPQGLKLWFGKRFNTVKTVPVINEVTNVRLQRYKKYRHIRCSIYVLLEDEVLDLCAGLTTCYRYRRDCLVAQLHLHVVIRPGQKKESSKVQASRESSLLRSLMALRCTASATVEGAAPDLAQDFSFRLSHQQYRNQITSQAVTELFSFGDNAFNIGDYTAALGYYYRAHDYYKHCAGPAGHPTDTGDSIVFSFTLGQKRARSLLEIHDFQGADREMDLNIELATGKFLTHDPKPTGSGVFPGTIPNWPMIPQMILPSMTEEENFTEADRREWKCKRLKGAAARFRQRITCEDIGRCYMYRSIALRCSVNEDSSLAAEDRLMSLACCSSSETSRDGCINELLELESRMMEYFVPGKVSRSGMRHYESNGPSSFLVTGKGAL